MYLVFAGLPEVFPRITRSVGKALRKFAMVQTIFVHKGNKMRQFCKDTLECEPEKVMDVFHECMKRGWGAKDNFDNVAEDVRGGEFCKGGWKFDAVNIPSPTVMEHQGICVSLVYEFGIKNAEKA
jgi:hypothetical protein